MKFFRRKNKKNPRGSAVRNSAWFRGFTMIELLVALSVFSLVSVMAVEVFLTSLKGSKQISLKQDVQESGRFMLESAAKEIRMSALQGITCGEATQSFDSLIVQNAKEQTVSYGFSSLDFLRNDQALNSDKVDVTFGRFYIQKRCNLQPRITIVMKLESGGVKIDLQNTISSREYSKESEK